MTKPKGLSIAMYWECTHAASSYYTKGRIYKLTKRDTDGVWGFIARDGLFDPKSLVISKFKESTEEDYNNQLQAL